MSSHQARPIHIQARFAARGGTQLSRGAEAVLDTNVTIPLNDPWAEPWLTIDQLRGHSEGLPRVARSILAQALKDGACPACPFSHCNPFSFLPRFGIVAAPFSGRKDQLAMSRANVE